MASVKWGVKIGRNGVGENAEGGMLNAEVIGNLKADGEDLSGEGREVLSVKRGLKIGENGVGKNAEGGRLKSEVIGNLKADGEDLSGGVLRVKIGGNGVGENAEGGMQKAEVVGNLNADGEDLRGEGREGLSVKRGLKIGGNGVLVPVRDTVALADAIELLVRDIALREKMGRASRALAVREFGIEQVVSDTFRVYGEGEKY